MYGRLLTTDQRGVYRHTDGDGDEIPRCDIGAVEFVPSFDIYVPLIVRAVTAREWLKIAYNAEGDNLYEAIHNQPGYRGINALATLSHRYLTEDIPMSLVPIASLGNRYGVSVANTDDNFTGNNYH